MKKIITSVITAAALMFGGAAAANATPLTDALGTTPEVTPLVVGSTVFYGQCQTSPTYTCGTSLKIVKTNGTWTSVSMGNSIGNVKQVCPGNPSLRIRVTGPNGGVKTHPYGACFSPGGVATYTVAHLG